jgi:Mycotoxin biosynthesis protein UstYa
VNRATAEKLPNKTIPVSSAPDAGYLVGLTVFHDLHCLDSIRKALWADRAARGEGGATSPTTPPSNAHESHDPAHLMHCIDSLRQSLMCHADVVPLSWQWSDTDGGVRAYSDVTHQCRDFDSVLQWGREHRFDGLVNWSGFDNGQPGLGQEVRCWYAGLLSGLTGRYDRCLGSMIV